MSCRSGILDAVAQDPLMRYQQPAARRKLRLLMQRSFEELTEDYHTVSGTPDMALEQLMNFHARLGMEHLVMYGQETRESYEATMANIGLF